MSSHEALEGALARAEMAHFDAALAVGATIQAWQSASGLRMVRVVSPYDEIWGFGKHPHADPAFVHAAIDYRMGHIPDSYGEKGIYPPHMIGSQDAETTLDLFLRRDGEIKAYRKEGRVICELAGYEATPVWTDADYDRVMAGQDVIIRDSPPGCVVRVYRKTTPHGHIGAGFELLEAPEGVNPNDFYFLQTSEAETFAQAVATALQAKKTYRPKGHDTFTPYRA